MVFAFAIVLKQDSLFFYLCDIFDTPWKATDFDAVHANVEDTRYHLRRERVLELRAARAAVSPRRVHHARYRTCYAIIARHAVVIFRAEQRDQVGPDQIFQKRKIVVAEMRKKRDCHHEGDVARKHLVCRLCVIFIFMRDTKTT